MRAGSLRAVNLVTHLCGRCHHLGGWLVTQMAMALILPSRLTMLTVTWLVQWICICSLHGHSRSPSTPTLCTMCQPGSRTSPASQKATVLRHAIWNPVPRRVLASWCRLLGRKGKAKARAKARRRARQRQGHGLPQPARMLPHLPTHSLPGQCLVATAGAWTLPNRRSLMIGLAARRAGLDNVDARLAARGRAWS